VLVVTVKIGNAVAGEELRRRPCRRSFLRDSFRTVLAELSRVPMTRVGIGPGTAHAVKAFGLIELQQGARGPQRAHLLH
jgi:hypothetical protein